MARRRRRRKRRGKRGDTFLKTRSGVRKKIPFPFSPFYQEVFFLHFIRYRNKFHNYISFFFVTSQALLITFWHIFYRSNFNLTFFDLTFILYILFFDLRFILYILFFDLTFILYILFFILYIYFIYIVLGSF